MHIIHFNTVFYFNSMFVFYEAWFIFEQQWDVKIDFSETTFWQDIIVHWGLYCTLNG